jgi:nucleotide-binding universal stress UspA family protein
MTTILRPTRGGEASFPNRDRVIALAKERGADLVFLYVSNVHFLDRVASPVLVDVKAELEELGEFLMAMAQECAEQAGVRAKAVVRHGEFRQALEDVIREYPEITTVVLGAAIEETSVTPPGYLKDLVQWLLHEAGVEVMVVHNGEIIEHHVP